jgi:polar amino acid transport system substrate-binding protein
LAVAAVVALALAGVGCQKKAEGPALTPKLAPPAIKQAGVLTAAIDPTQPPFAGTVDGQVVGLDVDVAAALAERLGLKLEIVKMPWSDVPAAVAKGTVDVGFAAIPITDAVLANVSVAGSYATDGIGLFGLATTQTAEATSTLTPEEASALISGARVACQSGSAAQWYLESEYWEGFATTYDTVREAFDALAAGTVDYVACDAFVGAYLARDYQNVRFVATLGEATPLGVLVAKDSTDLENAVRDVLDGMAADGTLATIRTKWVGDLPELRALGSSETTGSAE